MGTQENDESQDREILAVATAALVARVGALADAIQVFNHRIDNFSKELAEKPDDAEVKLITGLAHAERKRHLKWALLSAVVCAAIASSISYMFTTVQLHERNRVGYSGCISTNDRVHVIADSFRNVVKGASKASPMVVKVNESADRIEATVRDCERLYPKDQR